MNSVKIAIPSHRRRQIIETMTLPMLRAQGVNMADVYVFVSDETDAKDYASLPKAWGLNLVYNRELPDIVEKFNYIHYYFERGQRVIFVEDDIEELAIKIGENELAKFTKLMGLAESMFETCAKHRTKLWGISSNANPFYMKNNLAHGFKFVVANLFGFVSTKDPFLAISQHCKSDYERTLLYFVKFGGICRMDGVCAITRNYKNAGGLQEMKDQRAHLEREACRHLVKRFPHLVEINSKKSEKSMYMELRLRRIPKAKAGLDWMALQSHQDKELLKCRLRSEGTLNSR
jgi:hypothetical protein